MRMTQKWSVVKGRNKSERFRYTDGADMITQRREFHGVSLWRVLTLAPLRSRN